MHNPRVSRRSFLNALGGTAAVASLPGFPLLAHADNRSVAFVAVSDGIHTMEPFGSSWRSREFADAAAPQAMVLSANKSLLYVANGTDRYKALPTGSITAYRVTRGGSLRRVGSTQLALSAVRPYAIALSPDGALLVTASESGVVSLLSVDADGRPGAVVAAYKHLSAEPIALSFERNGLLHMTQGTSQRLFRVTQQNGFTFVSDGSSAVATEKPVSSYGMADAKAAVCLDA